MAQIHQQLLQDSLVLGRFELCHLLLAKDANYPWFILVPDREGIQEIYQLSGPDQRLLLEESSMLSEKLMGIFAGDKFNLAALGNQVPQLHLHHIVRYKTDPAWPGPVWGKVLAKAYDEKVLAELIENLKMANLIKN